MKPKIRGNLFMLVFGGTFSLVGGTFAVLGVMLLFAELDAQEKGLPVIFCILGFSFFAVGLSVLLADLRSIRKRRKLVENGRYVWGTVSSIETNLAVTINNRHPRYAMVCYTYGGQTHYFRSADLNTMIPDSIIGSQVKIYCQAPDFDHYYVDMDPLLGNVVFH